MIHIVMGYWECAHDVAVVVDNIIGNATMIKAVNDGLIT